MPDKFADNDIQQHEALLNEWAIQALHKDKGFIRDGIIDPQKWNLAPIKLLFINKEARDGEEDDSSDLRTFILRYWNGNVDYKTIATVSALAYGLNKASTDSRLRFPSYEQPQRSEFKEPLFSSAIMNIKKSDGRPTSNDTDLKKYVNADHDFITRQVALINPQIVICGGVWHLIDRLWGAKKIYDSVYEADGRIFIAFWHPSNRNGEQMMYYALAALVQNSDALTRYRR